MTLCWKLFTLVPALAVGAALLAGCPSRSNEQKSVPPPIAQSAAFGGTIFGGRQPIVGARVAAYAAGATLGAAPTEIGFAYSDSNGRFNMTFSPSPTAGQIVYVTAAGGFAGGGTNPAIGLATVAGPYCTSGNTGCTFPANVNIDELTTVATTAVLRGYIQFVDCTMISGNTETGACLALENTTGFSHMAGTIGNLVDVTTGQPSAFLTSHAATAGSPLRSTLEKLDTLADVLANCVNAIVPPSAVPAACTNLFKLAISNPTDTLRTAFAVADFPAVNARGLAFYDLLPASPIFSPTLAAAPAAFTSGFWTVGGERYAFVANSGGDDVSAWRLDRHNGSLDAVGTAPTGRLPRGGAVDPTGHYLYVPNFSGGNVSVWTIGNGGSLTPVAGNPCGGEANQQNCFLAGNDPDAVAVDPSSRYVYVANWSDDTVSAYTIGADGALSHIGGGPFLTGGDPKSVIVDATGAYVYVANNYHYYVSGFAVNADGSLTPLAAGQCDVAGRHNCFLAGEHPSALAEDPRSGYLYVANEGGHYVSAYTIGTGGMLIPISAGSCVGIGDDPHNCTNTGASPVALAVDSVGGFLYVANHDGGNVSAYAIGTGGTLEPLDANSCGTTPDPLNCFAAGAAPTSVAVDPTGRFLYVSNEGDGNASVYRIRADGSLDAVAGSPFAAGSNPITVAMDATGRYVYFTNSLSNGEVSAYTIGTGGAFTAIAGNPFEGANNPESVALDPRGRYVYAGNYAFHGGISAWVVGAGGVLAPVVGSPFGTQSGFSSAAADPSGRYLYAIDPDGNNLYAYEIGSYGALSAVTGSPFPTGDNPHSVAVDPSGRYVYVANYFGNNVSEWTIGAGGTLDPITANACGTTPDAHNCRDAGLRPRSIAVDPSGRYVYVANYTSGNVSVYTIGLGGALVPANGYACGRPPPESYNCFDAGNGPYSVTVDPGGSHVYVTNFVSADVYAYTIGTGGTLSQIGTPLLAGSGPASVVVDPTGHYAYVADFDSDDISSYILGAGGVLTFLGYWDLTPGSEPIAIVTGP